jgi:hypothetical protein
LSTILKALRRLEEEKAATEEPRPLREQIASAPPTSLRSRRTGWTAAAVALVLGVATGGAAIWWLFGRTSTPTQIAAANPMPPVPSAVVPPPPAPAPPARASEPGPPEQAFDSDVEMVNRPDALPRLADSEPVEPGPIQPKPGSVRPVENSAAAERARQAALAEYNAAERARRGQPAEVVPPAPPQPLDPIGAQPEPATPDVAQAAPPDPAPVAPPAPAAPPAVKPEPKAEVAPPAAKPAAKPVAARPAPPKGAAAKEPVPPPPPAVAVSVEKTQWHPLADRRIAWLNVPGESEPHRVVEGDVVDGLIVSKIEPSGVVFDRDGEKIRRGLGKAN